MIVVVEADDPIDAYDTVTEGTFYAHTLAFVGDPWPAMPLLSQHGNTYDTLDLIVQRTDGREVKDEERSPQAR
jgi:hypothetical protein